MVKTAERRIKEEKAYQKKLNKLKRGKRFGRWKSDKDEYWREYPKGKILANNYHADSCRCEYCMSWEKKRIQEKLAKEEIKMQDGKDH